MSSRAVLGIVYLIGISCLNNPDKTRNDCRPASNGYHSLAVWRKYCFWETWGVLRSAVEQGVAYRMEGGKQRGWLKRMMALQLFRY